MGIADSSLSVPTELADAGPHVRRVGATLVGQLETLKVQLAPLQDTWIGDAAIAYSALQMEWNQAALALFGDGVTTPGILGDIATRLDVSYQNYVATQQANTKQWIA